MRLILVLAIALLAAQVCVADVPEDARKVVDTYRDAIVTVQLVVETSMSYSGSNDKEERKVSATGTVIDPSGLVVASLTEIDPSKMYSEFMSDEEGGPKVASNVIDVKIRTEAGTEIAADIVLRDPDLDLAFIRPKKTPEAPMKFVDITQSASPQVADGLVILSRLGQIANRALAVRLDRVQAVVTKPRTLYVVDGDRLGCPAFAVDGKPVGTLVLRAAKSGGRGGTFSASDDAMLAVLPYSAVAKVAEQAKTAEPEKPAPEPKAEPKTPAKPKAK